MPSEFDRTVVWITVLLLALGAVMVYSASIAIAEAGRSTGNQPSYYLVRHLVFLAISVAAALIAFQVPTRVWQRFAPYLFVVGLVLLALGADSRHRARGEWRATLDSAGGL